MATIGKMIQTVQSNDGLAGDGLRCCFLLPFEVASTYTVDGTAQPMTTIGVEPVATYVLGKPGAVIGAFVMVATAPGSAKTATFKARKNGTADTAVIATVTGASATAGSIYDVEMPFDGDDTIGAEVALTSSGTASDSKMFLLVHLR